MDTFINSGKSLIKYVPPLITNVISYIQSTIFKHASNLHVMLSVITKMT